MGQYYSVSFASPENELFHHGVKGQRWGQRRYQNTDGSLTPEGREHYGVGEGRGSSSKRAEPSAHENRQSPFHARPHRGGPARGMTMPTPEETAVATFAVNKVRYELRKRNAQKEVEQSKLNKDKERVTKDNIKWMARHYNKKERNEILQRMKDNPNMSFNKAEDPVYKAHTKRFLKRTAAFMAASVAVPLALAYTTNHRDSISDKLHKADNAVKRNKMYQSFMQNTKNRKVKNAVVLRKDEYEIDRKRNLPAGRG